MCRSLSERELMRRRDIVFRRMALLNRPEGMVAAHPCRFMYPDSKDLLNIHIASFSVSRPLLVHHLGKIRLYSRYFLPSSATFSSFVVG